MDIIITILIIMILIVFLVAKREILTERFFSNNIVTNYVNIHLLL